MIVTILLGVGLVIASVSCALFLMNLRIYRPLPMIVSGATLPPVSVLIPARNEEKNIVKTLEAVLSNEGCAFEIIVLDDHSTDTTPALVRQLAARDERVRCEVAPELPSGWCGKQHACSVLATLATHPLLLFIDADVRLSPDSLQRMAAFMQGSTAAALASGVPRQELGTFSERLLIPLIHFILLGFLPMREMRRTANEAPEKSQNISAGCGQLFIARRGAYEQSGGHAMIRNSLHDGLKLPRVFRKAGFGTDLFDATDIATCRMYHTNAETWRGLGKNAAEGLAAPSTIGPMSAILFIGQVLPLLLLATCSTVNVLPTVLAALAVGAVYIPRFVAVRRFQQPLLSALLHPLGVLGLLMIQWFAFVRLISGTPSEWKGRSYILPDSSQVIPS